MKKVLLGFICLGLLMSAPLAYAQGTIKIGYFDMGRVATESKRMTQEREAILKRGNELKKNFDKKAEELKALKESLEKKGGMLSDQARKDKEREYQQKAKELDRLGQDADTELKQLNKEMNDRVTGKLLKVLKKLGEEGKYTVILDTAILPYVSKDLDITDQVIKAFDAAKE
jgi:outer membrane protein